MQRDHTMACHSKPQRLHFHHTLRLLPAVTSRGVRGLFFSGCHSSARRGAFDVRSVSPERHIFQHSRGSCCHGLGYIQLPASCVLSRITNILFSGFRRRFRLAEQNFYGSPIPSEAPDGLRQSRYNLAESACFRSRDSRFPDPAGYRGAPGMPGGALPPHFFIRVREDILGSEFSVTGKTPLLREVWVGSRQRFSGAVTFPMQRGQFRFRVRLEMAACHSKPQAEQTHHTYLPL